MFVRLEHKFMHTYLTQAEKKFMKFKSQVLSNEGHKCNNEALNGHPRNNSKT